MIAMLQGRFDWTADAPVYVTPVGDGYRFDPDDYGPVVLLGSRVALPVELKNRTVVQIPRHGTCLDADDVTFEGIILPDQTIYALVIHCPHLLVAYINRAPGLPFNPCGVDMRVQVVWSNDPPYIMQAID